MSNSNQSDKDVSLGEKDDRHIAETSLSQDAAAAEDVGDLTNGAVIKRLLLKTDLLVMPGLCLAYFTNVLDRSNLGNAKTDTIEKDLNLAPNDFSDLLMVFYVPYALFNIPWSLLAKRFNPSVVIPSAVCLWGAVTMAAIASKNVGHLMACRFFVGAIEASYKPCEIFYLSLFYTRKEMSFRVGMVGQMGFIAGAVSGLISWGVFQWNGALWVSLQVSRSQLSIN
jgi:MFS family permease